MDVICVHSSIGIYLYIQSMSQTNGSPPIIQLQGYSETMFTTSDNTYKSVTKMIGCIKDNKRKYIVLSILCCLSMCGAGSLLGPVTLLFRHHKSEIGSDWGI